MKLKYAIKFVADMDRAIAFHRDILGLKLAFQSPDWSEFDTGETRLALHISSEGYAPGSIELAFASEDLDAFYAARDANGATFLTPPTELPGRRVARMLDSEGAAMSVGG